MFLPVKYHRQRSLAGYSPWGHKGVQHNLATKQQQKHPISVTTEHWVGFPVLYMGFHSVQFSCSVVSNSLWPHGLQHTRPPWPSPTPRVYSNSCPLSQWCHPTISSSVIPFSSCPQSFQASGAFPMSQLFVSGGQSIGSFSFNISPSNEHLGLISFRTDWLDLLAAQGALSKSSPTPQFKSINSSVLSFLHSPTLTYIHDYWKNHSLD